MEKRKQDRTSIVLQAQMSYRGIEARDLVTRNISLGGVFVEPADYAPPRQGETVTLHLSGGQAGGDGRSFRARVARSGPDGVALLFQDFDLEDFAFLQELMG